jgi:hypothetical protein
VPDVPAGTLDPVDAVEGEDGTAPTVPLLLDRDEADGSHESGARASAPDGAATGADTDASPVPHHPQDPEEVTR